MLNLSNRSVEAILEESRDHRIISLLWLRRSEAMGGRAYHMSRRNVRLQVGGSEAVDGLLFAVLCCNVRKAAAAKNPAQNMSGLGLSSGLVRCIVVV